MNVAIITAAGCGSRAQLNMNKNLARFGNSTVIERTVANFLAVEEIDQIVVTASKDDISTYESLLLPISKKIKIVLGGDTRQQSVYNALVSTPCDFVLIHDGARPNIEPELIKKCLYNTIINGSCVLALPVSNTLGKLQNGQIVSTGRTDFLSLQTPQAFKYDQILKAHTLAKNDQSFTDDCGIYCKFIGPCRYMEGSRENVKLTYPEDFINDFRVGTGFDLHKLVENRPLVLGGVTIPHTKGLLGHSDADAVIHALMDAILSACALKDIGTYFPDTDQSYKGISSMLLLEKVVTMVSQIGFKICNASICIMAEKPKLAPFVDGMKTNIASALNISPSLVGITCTTLEGLGIVGREEGIACQAYCSVKKVN